MLVFIWPWVFALTPLPLLVWLLVPKASQTQQAALRVPALDDFRVGGEPGSQGRGSGGMILFAAVIWLLLIAAAARPQWLGDIAEVPVSGRDLMLAVDLSGSMRHRDFRLNFQRVDRLTAAKWVVARFVTRRKSDRVGLIVFGTKAYLHVPLTFDTKTVITLLNETFVGMAGDSTAIGDAIGLAVKRLRNTKADRRVLILLTDGKNTDGTLNPVRAAELARHMKMTIYTIGIGSLMSASIDESTLREIARVTDGRYFRAQNIQQLNEIYSYIDRLEPIEKQAKRFRPRRALYHWVLALVVVLVSLVLGYRLWKDCRGVRASGAMN